MLIVSQQIAHSLQSMLDFNPSDGRSFEETFMSTFSISYTDMYACQRIVDLKEGGDKIPVTMVNTKVVNCNRKRAFEWL